MAQKVSKSLLSPFFKLIHPDVLSSAPVDVRVSNSAALRSLNHYFDEVQEGHSVSSTPLRFFLPHQKQYKEVSFTLKSFAGSSDADYCSLHLKSMIRGLLNTTKENGRAGQNEMVDLNNKESERLFHHASIIHQVSSLVRRDQQYERRFQLQQSLLDEIGDFPFATRTDPILDAVVTSSIRKTLVHRLERANIPEHCLFFSPKLNEEQKRTAINTLTEGIYRGKGGPEAVMRLYEQLFRGNTYIPLFVSDRFSVSAVPGYLQVPFNLQIADLLSFANEKTAEIAIRLQDFQQYHKMVSGLISRLIATKSVAAVILGREKYQNEEEYTEIRFQSYMEMATKLESVLEPKGLMQDFSVVLGRRNRKLGEREVEIALTATRLEIYQLIR